MQCHTNLSRHDTSATCHGICSTGLESPRSQRVLCPTCCRYCPACAAFNPVSHHTTILSSISRSFTAGQSSSLSSIALPSSVHVHRHIFVVIFWLRLKWTFLTLRRLRCRRNTRKSRRWDRQREVRLRRQAGRRWKRSSTSSPVEDGALQVSSLLRLLGLIWRLFGDSRLWRDVERAI